MSVYMIAMYDLTDEHKHLEYASAAGRILEKHNGRLLGATTSGHLLEGEPVGCGVVIDFPTHKDAMAFYNDTDYQEIKPLRHASTTNANVMLIDAPVAIS